MSATLHRLFEDEPSRRSSSRSMASRMNSPRLFGPAMASMRAATSAVMRIVVTTVSVFSFSGGRPIRRGVPDSIESVNSPSNNVFCY